MYQMPNFDSLMKNVAEINNGDKEGELRSTSLDMVYAYGRTVLHPEKAKHSNVHIIGGLNTGTYAFRTD